MRNDRENIIDFAENLYESKKFPLANQIFKSATSIGANVREAQNAESKADFIHKLKIAAKEADETQYWLLLCSKSPHLKSPNEKLISDLNEILLILSKIISSSKLR
jgi:four helix bundle protein